MAPGDNVATIDVKIEGMIERMQAERMAIEFACRLSDAVGTLAKAAHELEDAQCFEAQSDVSAAIQAIAKRIKLLSDPEQEGPDANPGE